MNNTVHLEYFIKAIKYLHIQYDRYEYHLERRETERGKKSECKFVHGNAAEILVIKPKKHRKALEGFHKSCFYV